MLLRVEQGKGRKDRFAMLSPMLLDILREWWRIGRPCAWLFPGQNPVNPMTTRQLNRICHMAAQLAEIGKRVSLHTLREIVYRAPEQKVCISVSWFFRYSAHDMNPS